jgi:hypothetical protein
MTHRPLRLGERIYGFLVGLYPKRFRQQFGWSMKQTFRDLLDDPDMPTSRIWLSVLRDLSGSFFHEHLANLTGGRFMTRFPLPVGALRVAMVVVLIGATPLATGVVGYHLGRSQVQPVAEPTSPQSVQTFFLDQQLNRWMTFVYCPVASAPGLTEPVLVAATAANPPRCPTAHIGTFEQNSRVDLSGLQRLIRDRTSETGPGR